LTVSGSDVMTVVRGWTLQPRRMGGFALDWGVFGDDGIEQSVWWYLGGWECRDAGG
jgi:hypothetical protein